MGSSSGIRKPRLAVRHHALCCSGNAVFGRKLILVASKKHLTLRQHPAYRAAFDEKSGLSCRLNAYASIAAQRTQREE